MNNSISLVLLSAAMLIGSLAQASAVTFEFDTVFSSGSVAPVGNAPYLTAEFDDGGTAGSVTLTMTIASTVGIAKVDDVYFNFDPAFDVTNLMFEYDSVSTGPAAAGNGNGIFTGVDAHKADGDGFYDINMNFPPPPGSMSSRWQASEVVVYNITSSEAITANSFTFLSAPGGGAGGPFFAAAHFQSTGPSGNDSAWVAAVPVPAAVWLFGSGLLGLVGVARRKRA